MDCRPPADGDVRWPVAVDLSNGRTHEADLVICALGVVPNAAWLPKELERSLDDGGVLVDRHVLLSMPSPADATQGRACL